MAPPPDWRLLFERAAAARERAYAPYSKFRVGAAALTDDGQIVSGCNMENASYGLSVCAERHALAAAVLAGSRRFTAMAIVAGGDEPCPPCGACRQVMAELGEPTAEIRFRSPQGEERAFRLSELLPQAFGPGFL